MQILYAVTLRSANKKETGLFHKMNLVAGCQVEALKMASEKATLLGCRVIKVVELETLEGRGYKQPELSEPGDEILTVT